MIRVAYLTQAPFISGAERSLQTLLRYAHRVEIEPVLVCPSGSALLAWGRQHDLQVVECPLPVRDKWRAVQWWSGVRKLHQVFQRHRVDLVHANQVWCFQAAAHAAGRLRLPRVCHLRDEVDAATVDWWMGDDVDLAIAISRHIERQFRAVWQSPTNAPVQTLINPVECPPRPSSQQASTLRCEARHKLDLDNQRFAFGFIGQIVPVKGLALLLEALSALASDCRWQLVVAGRDPRPHGDHVAECRALAERFQIADRVYFVGFLDQPDDFYQAIDLAVVPSLEEPLGRIPLEAAAHGKPSIAFAAGGLPETIVDGVTGTLVPVGDVPALRRAVARSIDCGSHSDQGDAAWRHVREIAGPDAYVRRLAGLYQTLLNRGE